MRMSTLKAILGYGLLAAAVLGCLQLISMAPLSLDWGRELIAAAIAIVAMAIGVRLSQRQAPTTTQQAEAADGPVTAEPVEPVRESQSSELSARERQVLGLLARGLSNKLIARELTLSENTIKTHLANVYAKLEVSRRTEALAAARKLGLLNDGREPPVDPGR